MYILYNGFMFDCTQNEVDEKVSKEFEEETIVNMKDFIKTLEEEDFYDDIANNPID